MEVQTAMTLLEKMIRFKCFGGRKEFYVFLNKQDYPVELSAYHSLFETSRLEELRKGHPTQKHIEVSLRKLEERNYQIKYTNYVVQTDTNEVLCLKLRDRFELQYGVRDATQECFFKYSTGLKPLMAARIKSPNEYEKRVEQARRDIEKSDLHLTKTNALQDNLLVYLGHEIISMTSDRTGPEKSVHEYSKLLRYSSKLLTTQLNQDRPYLEAFLYYALLHWPAESRCNLQDMCPLVAYNRTLEEWKSAYENNFEIGTQTQHRKDKAKTYFALGQGVLGKELVDVELLKKYWKDDKKQAEGRFRKHVLRDNFWKEPYVERALERLSGTLDDSGNVITYRATNYLGSYNFNIHTYIPYPDLSNRKVSFVLGFRWNGLTALDVEETDHEEMRRAQRQEVRRQLDARSTVTVVETFEPNMGEALKTDTVPNEGDTVSQRKLNKEWMGTGGASGNGTLLKESAGPCKATKKERKVFIPETHVTPKTDAGQRPDTSLAVQTPAVTDQTLAEAVQAPAVTDQTLAEAVQTPAVTDQTLAEAVHTHAVTNQARAKTVHTHAVTDQACAKAVHTPPDIVSLVAGNQDQRDDIHRTDGASASPDTQPASMGGIPSPRDGDVPGASGMTSKQRKNQRKKMRKREKRGNNS